MRSRLGSLSLVVALLLPVVAWGQGAPASAGLGPGHRLLQMPLVAPGAADAFFAGRVVPPSNVPAPRVPSGAAARALDRGALAAPPVLGHPLPATATTPEGRPRADFAIAPSGAPQPSQVAPHGIGRQGGNTTAPAPQTATTLGLAPRALRAAAATPPAAAANSATPSVAAAAALTCTPPADDPEIVALARALSYDLNLIYEYVYYNVEYSPTWGLKKSALGTYLDRRGNNLDQNVLFVALLRQSCITANFRNAYLAYTGDQVANLMGVQNNATVLNNVLGAGGFSGCVLLTATNNCANGVTTGGTAAQVILNVVWTEATVNGTTYQLDPSLKSHTIRSPINFATASGYSQSSFLATALAGSSSVTGLPAGVNSIRGVNAGGLKSVLNSYSHSLRSYIQNNFASSTTKQVFGGLEISNTNYGATYPAAGTLYTSLPTSFLTVYTVTVSNNADGSSPTFTSTLYANQISGKRLTLTYNASRQPVLALDGSVLATGAATSATTQTVSLTVSNPYPAGANHTTATARPTVTVGNTFAIMLMAGETGRDQLTRHQNAIRRLTQAGSAATSEPVLGETLAAIGAAYLSQASRALVASDPLFGMVSVWHTCMGIAGQGSAPYVDFPSQLLSVNATSSTAPSLAWFGTGMAHALWGSALESTAVTQMQQNPAVSTVRLFDLANGVGTGFVEATPSNWASLQSRLTGWRAADVSAIGSFLSSSATTKVILPLNGSTTLNRWTGGGWFNVNIPSSTSLSVSYLISGSYAGGYGSVSEPTPSAHVAQVFQVLQSASSAIPNPVGNDPIDLQSGTFQYQHEDISVGSAAPPFGLAFSRAYDSRLRAQTGPMGYGWTHKFATSVLVDSDSFEGFGDHGPINAIAAMVAFSVIKDVMSTSNAPISNMTVSSIVASWLMDQLVNNAVTINIGTDTHKFIKVPTSSSVPYYNPPNGNGAKLQVATDGTITLTDKTQNVHSFAADGTITQSRDPNGNTITYAYAGTGTAKRLQSVTNGMGRTFTFSYNAANLLAGVSDGSRSVTYAYDASSNLTSYSDSAATPAVTRFVYDQPGRLTQVFYPSFPSTPFVTNVYDSFGRVQTQTDALGNQWSYLFANGTRGAEVDPTGAAHVIYFDAAGNRTRDIDPTGAVTTLTSDGVGRPAMVTSPANVKVSYAYDLKGNVLTKTTTPIPGVNDPLTGPNPSPIVERSWYDPTFNKPTMQRNGRGHITQFTYDGAGNLTQTIQPAVTKGGISGSPTTTVAYGARGLPSQVTDPEGKVTTFSYDPATFDLLGVTVDAGTGRLNLTTSYTYDATGNKRTTTDPRGNTTTLTYDGMRRVIQAIPPAPFAANIATTTYDLDGRPTQVAQATGIAASPWRITGTTYNAAGKPVTVTAPDATTKTAAYDSVQRVATVTSSSGRQTVYAYDAASRLTRITDGVSGALDPSITVNLGSVVREQRTYWGSGDLATLADGKGNALTFYYDQFRRLEEVLYPDNNYDVMAYDANGNKLVTQTRSGGQVWLTYDALNRVATKAPTNQATITYGYDFTGRLLQLQASTDTAPYAYGYDTAGRAVSESRPDVGGTVTWTLDPNGNRTSLTWPETGALAYAVSYGYDALNRLTDVYEGPASSGALLGHYSYDALSQRTGLAYGGTTAAAGGREPVANTALGWTAAGQIAQLEHAFNGSALTLAYAYNADHQRTAISASDATFLVSGLPAGNHSYAANVLNAYTTVDGAAYGYDLNGNLTSTGTWTFAYDAENHLTGASATGMSAAYAYDPQGRRKAKTVNGTTTNYLSVGSQEIAEYDGAGSLLRRYVYGPGLDEPLATVDAAGNRSYHVADALGSVIALANASGQVTEKHAYSAYGLAASTSGTAFQFAGRRLDPETGLYYMRARYYSPVLGRFLQTDPIGIGGGINLYAYVGNDPVNAIDPNGLASQSTATAAPAWPTPDYSAGPSTAFVPPIPAIGLGAGQATGSIGLGTIGALTLPLALSGDTPASGRDSQFLYLTYTRTNPDTLQVYSGRTSGWAGTMDDLNALASQRGSASDQQWLTNAGFGLPAVDRYSDSYNAIRGREQQLIDYHGGAQSVGGTAANRINGIGDWNPLRPLYMYEATSRWGALPDNSPSRYRLGW